MSVRDLRPSCRYCGRIWQPAQGVDANTAYCPACSEQRRATAREAVIALGALEVRTGNYVVRVPRNNSA